MASSSVLVIVALVCVLGGGAPARFPVSKLYAEGGRPPSYLIY